MIETPQLLNSRTGLDLRGSDPALVSIRFGSVPNLSNHDPKISSKI